MDEIHYLWVTTIIKCGGPINVWCKYGWVKEIHEKWNILIKPSPMGVAPFKEKPMGVALFKESQ